MPVREPVEVLEATLRDTLPLPEPDAPAVTVIHELLLTAVHEQPVVPVTDTVYEPPLAPADWLAGEMLELHAAAACVTVYDLPPAVTVALRLVPTVFVATL